jgi:hypothetical protein
VRRHALCRRQALEKGAQVQAAILIVLRWLGWSAPGISEAEALKLWNIVEIGLGGYVIGRSAEKTLPRIVEVLKR